MGKNENTLRDLIELCFSNEDKTAQVLCSSKKSVEINVSITLKQINGRNFSLHHKDGEYIFLVNNSSKIIIVKH